MASSSHASSQPVLAAPPAGCTCSIEPEEGDFTWTYRIRTCPIKLEDHPWYLPIFQQVVDQGLLMGGINGRGFIQVETDFVSVCSHGIGWCSLVLFLVANQGDGGISHWISPSRAGERSDVLVLCCLSSVGSCVTVFVTWNRVCLLHLVA